MLQEIRPGGKLDILTEEEARRLFRVEADELLRQRARGVTFHREDVVLSPAANQYLVRGPDPGFDWILKLISAQLSGNSGFDIYVGSRAQSNTTVQPRAQIYNGTASQAQQVATWSSDQVVIPGGTQITLDAVTSGVTILSYYLTAVQVPSERLGDYLS